jgi:5'-nucleotidase / UDP-sugar diphosphatase
MLAVQYLLHPWPARIRGLCLIFYSKLPWINKMIDNRKIFATLVSLCLIIALRVPATAAQAPNGAEYDQKISIIHTNDQHGIVDGEQYVKGLADAKKAAGDYVLTLCAGDVIQGEPINALTQGESVVKVMNAAGYDALVPGNNEFISGLDHLLDLNRMLKNSEFQ